MFFLQKRVPYFNKNGYNTKSFKFDQKLSVFADQSETTRGKICNRDDLFRDYVITKRALVGEISRLVKN